MNLRVRSVTGASAMLPVCSLVESTGRGCRDEGGRDGDGGRRFVRCCREADSLVRSESCPARVQCALLVGAL